MSKIERVEVPLPGRAYPILIGPGARASLADVVSDVGRVNRVAVIADRRVAGLHLDSLRAALPEVATVQQFDPGEGSKTLGTVARLLDGLAEARLERQDLVVTFGGGIAGDVGGFVAACWLRGIRFLQVPTTIEAAVDASVGGKTGVNHASGKNLIGAFHQPAAVVIDTDFLATLDQRDFVAGLAESVKHAAIREPDFLDWHETHGEAIVARQPALVSELIARNCAIKADVVARDERENNLRAILNYGHTFGHAFELLTGYKLRHGEAVSLGIVAENALAEGRGLLDALTARRIRQSLVACGLPTLLPDRLDADEVLDACRMDKKNRAGRVNFVLVTALGQTQRVDDVSDDEMRAALGVVQPR